MLDRLGIPADRESEVYHCGEIAPGLHLHGGWFHFVGRIVAGQRPSNVNARFVLDSEPNQRYTVNFYVSSEGDASGYGEGAGFVGTTTVQTDAGGHAEGIASVRIVRDEACALPPASAYVCYAASGACESLLPGLPPIQVAAEHTLVVTSAAAMHGVKVNPTSPKSVALVAVIGNA